MAYVMKLEPLMTILNVTEARASLYKLISETTETHQPIVITGKRGNAVLVAEADWNSIYETLFLVSISGMRKSIREGMAANLDDCDPALDW